MYLTERVVLRNYHYTVHNNPEERNSYLIHSRSRKTYYSNCSK